MTSGLSIPKRWKLAVAVLLNPTDRACVPFAMDLPDNLSTNLRFVRSRRDSWLYVREIGKPSWPSWLICQPGLEESVHARSSLAILSNQLALKHRASISVDYEGDGHSDGDVGTVGLSDWADDAIDAFKASSRRLDTILGIRLGAAVALKVAANLRPRVVVLYDPVIDGEAWLMQALRSNLTTQLTAYRKVVESRSDMFRRVLNGEGTCNVAGYDIGSRFAHSLVTRNEKSTIDDLLTLIGSSRVHLVYSSQGSAQASSNLHTALHGKVDIRISSSQEPPVWAESAMSGTQCAWFHANMLAIAGT